jgi:hypothetical protein
MPYNEEIDARIRKVVSRWKNSDAKKMFGGVCHLLNGNMVCKLSYTKPFDITGKPMKGWVMVEGRGFKTDEKLKSWLIKARTFVKTLAPK